MAEARKKLDWEAQYSCAMFPEAARAKRDQRPPEEEDTCTMCGNYCAVKIVNEWLDQSDSDLIKQIDSIYFILFLNFNFSITSKQFLYLLQFYLNNFNLIKYYN